MKKIVLAVATLFATNALAGDLNQIGTLTQNQFLKLSTDLGAAGAYKGVTPATPVGLSGFDIGVELTQTSIENSSVFRQAGAGDVSNLYVPKIHITKGLPGGFDIGAFVSRVSGVDGTLIGLEARYAILDDGLTTPALGMRLSGSKLSGVNKLDLSTMEVVDQYPAPGGPDCIELSADGRLLMVTSRWARKLTVIDTETRKIVRQVNVGTSPHGVWTLDHAPRF